MELDSWMISYPVLIIVILVILLLLAGLYWCMWRRREDERERMMVYHDMTLPLQTLPVTVLDIQSHLESEIES